VPYEITPANLGKLTTGEKPIDDAAGVPADTRKKGRRRRKKPPGKTIDQYGTSELLEEVWQRVEADGPGEDLSDDRTEVRLVLGGITIKKDGAKYGTEADYRAEVALKRRKEW